MAKLSHRVVFPFELKIVNTTADCEDADAPYDLIGVVVHMGAQPNHGGSRGRGTGGRGVSPRILGSAGNRTCEPGPNRRPASPAGHYVALVKSSGQWICFDDDQVLAISESQVRLGAWHVHRSRVRRGGGIGGEWAAAAPDAPLVLPLLPFPPC